MANAVEKLNTIEIGDIEKVNTLDDDAIENLNTLEYAGEPPLAWGGTRGIQFGGNVASSYGQSNQIQYRTIQSTSDTADFGNLVLARDSGAGATSNISRAIMHDGNDGVDYSGGVMDYVTVGSTANASDFGDITGESIGSAGAAMSNGTLAFMCAGFDTSGTYRDLDMSYVTIASTGNSTDAGDIIEGVNYCSSNSGDTRGLIWNGN